MTCKHMWLKPLRKDRTGIDHLDFALVPCGKCDDCLRKKANDWATRVELEQSNSLSCYTVSLTYDDENIPPKGVSREDITLYHKRLRKYLDEKYSIKIRYYGISDYGGKFGRPHYHIIYFLDIKINMFDLQHIIEKIWHKGIVYIDETTIKSIRYIAKYFIIKPDKTGFVNDPFTIYSLGIGKSYLTNKQKKWHEDNTCFEMLVNNRKTYMPRYYIEKLNEKIVKNEKSRKQAELFKRRKIEQQREYAISNQQQRARGYDFDKELISRDIQRPELLRLAQTAGAKTRAKNRIRIKNVSD